MKGAVKLAKKILDPLRITAAAPAIDAGIQNKIHGSGKTTLIISNKEKNYIMRIVRALEGSNTLLKVCTKRRIFRNVIRYFRSYLLENMLTGKGILRAGYGSKNLQSKKGKGMLWAGYGNKEGKGILRAGYGSEGSSLKTFFNSISSFSKL